MCDVPRCNKKDYALSFYGYSICESCWDDSCEGKLDLKKALKIEEEKKPVIKKTKIQDWCD